MATPEDLELSSNTLKFLCWNYEPFGQILCFTFSRAPKAEIECPSIFATKILGMETLKPDKFEGSPIKCGVKL